MVQTKTGITLCDDDDTIELPSSYSKIYLYCKLMHLWGCFCKVDGLGSFEKHMIMKKGAMGNLSLRENARRYCR